MEKISLRQLRFLLILNIIGTVILVIPSALAARMKQDAWLAIILGSVFGLLLVKLLLTFAKRFPELDLVQIMEKLLGKFFGKLLALIFIAFSFITGAETIWYVRDFMVTAIIPEISMPFFHFLFAGAVILAIRFGIENFACLAELSFPFIIILFLLLIGMSLPYAKVTNLLPMFADNSIKTVLGGTIDSVTFITPQLISFAMIFPKFVDYSKKAADSYLVGYFAGGAMLLITVLASILVLGSNLSADATFTSFFLAKKVSLGFIDRAEGLLAFIWLITIFFRTTTYYYGAVSGLTRVLELKDYRRVALPLGFCLIPLSIIVYSNYAHKTLWDSTSWIAYYFCLGCLPLIILLLAAIIRANK
jgi:spore germination protein KB